MLESVRAGVPWFCSALEGAVTSTALVSSVHAHTFTHPGKGQRSGSGSTLKTAIHVSKRGTLIGGQTEGLLGLSYSLRRARGERSREQEYPLVTMTPGPRMFFCWFLVFNS